MCPIPIHNKSISIYPRDCELGANMKDSPGGLSDSKQRSPTFETCMNFQASNQRPGMAREFRNSDPLSKRARTCCRGRRLLPHGEHQSPNRSPGHGVLITARPTSQWLFHLRSPSPASGCAPSLVCFAFTFLTSFLTCSFCTFLLVNICNMKAFATLGAVLLPFIASTATGIELNPDDEASIKAAARTYAYGLMELYQGNATGTAIENIGIWPQPHYWWEGGKKP